MEIELRVMPDFQEVFLLRKQNYEQLPKQAAQRAMKNGLTRPGYLLQKLVLTFDPSTAVTRKESLKNNNNKARKEWGTQRIYKTGTTVQASELTSTLCTYWHIQNSQEWLPTEVKK